MTKCEICSTQINKSQYLCKDCKTKFAKKIIYLLENIPINKEINTTTLLGRQLMDEIDLDDLFHLSKLNLLKKDRYRNYTWTSLDDVQKFIEQNGTKKDNRLFLKITRTRKTKQKTLDLFIKNDKKESEDKKDDIEKTLNNINTVQNHINMTETFTIKDLKERMDTDDKTVRSVINDLKSKKLIRSNGRRYYLNIHEIAQFELKHKDKIKTKDKIETINNIETVKIGEETSLKDDKIEVDKRKYNPKLEKQKHTIPEKRVKNRYALEYIEEENEVLPIIRRYIEEMLIITPKKITTNDVNINQLYDEFKRYLEEEYNKNIKKYVFEEHFENIIYTIPNAESILKNNIKYYNIKQRNEPTELLESLYKVNKQFENTKEHSMDLNENDLELSGNISYDEYPLLLNLLSFTYENVKSSTIEHLNDCINIKIVYDLEDEDIIKWKTFIQKYNWV